MPRAISITVNGTKHSSEVEPSLLLVEYLREKLLLTGTHVGCDTSQCGACTVLVDGQATKACTVLAVQADGTAVTTVEGLATDGVLHPVQRAFQTQHATQCGFCTPGMIITAVDLIARNRKPTEAEIRHAIKGNLCRCTGYQNIVRAIEAAAAETQAVTGVEVRR
ncbi:MAG: aerobic carbon-monoxide dehydrogenase small subunit [Chloroflexota bacterium]|jgi:carbon-monoxide dehydrogenase small subunit|nr:aerobic carbon-monoxide dehydrogenase small subunit [Chloroflexota bacterium]